MIGYAATIPLDKIAKVSLYVNASKQKMSDIKNLLQCDHILNAGLYNMSTFKPVNWLVVNGQTMSNGGNPYGYSMQGSKIAFSYENNVKYPDFIGGYPCLIANSAQAFTSTPAGLTGDRGRSAIGMTKGALVLRCVPDVAGDADYTLFELTRDLFDLGCVNAINLDGGGSSQCDFGGRVITSGRTVHNFICVWLKKEQAPNVYTNGPIRKPIYETTECKKEIGSLDPNETCGLLYQDKAFAVVTYFITGSNGIRKVGYVRL